MEVSAVPRPGGLHIPIGKALLIAMGDDALVEQARRGNERAFEVIYDRYHAGLLAFCRHLLGSADEAEDALQQVFVAAHGDLLRSRRHIVLKPWLYTIARNRCISMLRARRERTSESLEISSDGLSDEVERRIELRALLADMRELGEDQRTALVLAEIGDLTHAEIGHVIGCPAAKVKALIFQARSALIDARNAREIPCAEIREQLATLRGGALRRTPLRRHLKVCPGCAEFRNEVRRQRAMMALLVPVVPSAELKRSVLAAAGIGSSGGGATLLAGVAGKVGLGKVLAACAVGAVAVGGGVELEQQGALPFTSGGHDRPAASVAPTAPTLGAPNRAQGAAAGPVTRLSAGGRSAGVVAPGASADAPAAPGHTRAHHHPPAWGHTRSHGNKHGVANAPAASHGQQIAPAGSKARGHSVAPPVHPPKAGGQTNRKPASHPSNAAQPVHPDHPVTPTVSGSPVEHSTKALPQPTGP